MNVHLYGFALTLGQGVTANDLFNQVRAIIAKPVRFANFDRIIYMGETGDYYVGLFLTIKDQKKFTELVQTKAVYKVKVHQLKGSAVDFNFFVIHKTTLRGLYQHYHQSCSVNQFCEFLSRRYDEVKEQKVALAEVAKGPDIDPKDQRAINKEFKGSLDYAMMCKPESLRMLLEEMSAISVFEFELMTLSVDGGLLSPLTGKVSKEKHTIRISREVVPRGVIGSITQFVSEFKIRRGRIVGRDKDGDPEILRLLDTPDSFGEFPYEELADTDILTLDDIAASPFLAKMLAVVKTRKAIFEAPEAE